MEVWTNFSAAKLSNCFCRSGSSPSSIVWMASAIFSLLDLLVPIKSLRFLILSFSCNLASITLPRWGHKVNSLTFKSLDQIYDHSAKEYV